MLACSLLTKALLLPSYNENVQNVLISALVYIEYHILRIKSCEDLRPHSNIMKRPGEKWDLTSHLYYILPTTLHKLPIKLWSVAATSEGGTLDLEAISEH